MINIPGLSEVGWVALNPIGWGSAMLQRTVVMVLEAIYEQDFHDCSYGFRSGRSAHQALESLWTQTMKTGGGWILEVDIRKFFDTLDHGQLRYPVTEVEVGGSGNVDRSSGQRLRGR